MVEEVASEGDADESKSHPSGAVYPAALKGIEGAVGVRKGKELLNDAAWLSACSNVRRATFLASSLERAKLPHLVHMASCTK